MPGFKKHKQYRLPEFDYSSDNAYFITIVTKNREHFFGEISNGEMFFTEIGLFVEENFKTINEKFDHLQLHEYVVMPNHIHFLAVINQTEEREYRYSEGLQPLISKSVSSFTNQLKGVVTKWCRNNGFENFAWQARFHDRVIRDSAEYYAVKNYIKNNVANWQNDTEL